MEEKVSILVSFSNQGVEPCLAPFSYPSIVPGEEISHAFPLVS